MKINENIETISAGSSKKRLMNMLLSLQNFCIVFWETLTGLSYGIKYRNDTAREMYLIGAQSFPIVFLGGLFVGIILSLETGYRFEVFGAKTMVGRTVSLGLVRELGPVISGLLFAARTGAKNSSEIGTMKISEQTDALLAYGVNPIHKLVVPRVIASVVMFLPLVLIADMAGIAGGMLVAKLWLNLDFAYFWKSAIYGLQMKDLFVGFVKPVFFGLSIALISCYYGLTTKGGTSGVGRSTINAVVSGSIAVLVMDFIFTKVVWELM